MNEKPILFSGLPGEVTFTVRDCDLPSVDAETLAQAQREWLQVKQKLIGMGYVILETRDEKNGITTARCRLEKVEG